MRQQRLALQAAAPGGGGGGGGGRERRGGERAAWGWRRVNRQRHMAEAGLPACSAGGGAGGAQPPRRGGARRGPTAPYAPHWRRTCLLVSSSQRSRPSSDPSPSASNLRPSTMEICGAGCARRMVRVRWARVVEVSTRARGRRPAPPAAPAAFAGSSSSHHWRARTACALHCKRWQPVGRVGPGARRRRARRHRSPACTPTQQPRPSPGWPAPPDPAAPAARWPRPPPPRRSGHRTWPPPRRRAQGTWQQNWWGSAGAGTACTGCTAGWSSPGSCARPGSGGARRVTSTTSVTSASHVRRRQHARRRAGGGGGGGGGGCRSRAQPVDRLGARPPLTGSRAGTPAAAPWLLGAALGRHRVKVSLAHAACYGALAHCCWRRGIAAGGAVRRKQGNGGTALSLARERECSDAACSPCCSRGKYRNPGERNRSWPRSWAAAWARGAAAWRK